MKFSKTKAILLLPLFISSWTHANVIYDYTGKNFTEAYGSVTTSDHINISISLDTFLPANRTQLNVTELVGFTFKAQAGTSVVIFGENDYEESGLFLTLDVTTDALSNIVEWELFWSKTWPRVYDEFNDEFYSYTVGGATVGSPNANFEKYWELSQGYRGRPSWNTIANQYSDIPGVWRVTNVDVPTTSFMFFFACIGIAVRSYTKQDSHAKLG